MGTVPGIVTRLQRWFLSYSGASGAVLEHPGAVLEMLNRCPNYNHHRDLENPGMGQLEHDCKKLLKRQESSFLLTLTVKTGGAAVGQDL